ncbi:MAG: NAD-dependent deacetylase [Gammaproteobacteria bacterium]|nr:NAD-dependent deacetylase [Gammaproteobacteria bacterium]
MALDPDLTTFHRYLEEAERIAIFTGAGISTESGIPDFRSPGGIWSKTTPVYFDDFISSEEARRRAWRQKIESDKTMSVAAPNRGHVAVARLVEMGQASEVITQNVDGLHQRAGVPDDKVIELHGNSTYAKCLSCAKRYELAPIFEAFARDGTLPVCTACDGLVKTATISFGQSMPQDEMARAEKASGECDLFIAIGSSLVVYPAAGFPVYAKQRGARLVILNRDPTDLDGHADLVLNREIGPTLSAAVGLEVH